MPAPTAPGIVHPEIGPIRWAKDNVGDLTDILAQAEPIAPKPKKDERPRCPQRGCTGRLDEIARVALPALSEQTSDEAVYRCSKCRSRIHRREGTAHQQPKPSRRFRRGHA